MGNRQKLKQVAVKALEHDIVNLDANALEYIGHSLIQVLEGVSLIHRGLNRDGKPVGYTLDTFSADRKIVGEYSTEEGYFDTPFKKLLGDCAHSKKLAPDCKKLVLISNRPCKNSDWPNVAKEVKDVLGDGITIDVYDSQRLADRIYEQTITKNSLVEYFADFLPSLWKAWTENAISHALPETPPDYVEDQARAQIIADALAKSSTVALCGISGTGKSYAAIDYARKYSEKFRNVVWISGTELTGVANLTAVKIARLGVDINLASQLCTAPCLLIIDDWKSDASLIVGLLPKTPHPETRVLVTCIDTPSAGIASVNLPPLSNPAATRVLELGLDDRPAGAQAQEICRRVGSHPLTLAIIRDTVRELGVTWQTIIDDLPNIPNYEGPNHETILQRILLNHGVGVADELRVLKRLGVIAIDAALALAVLGAGGLAKLLRRSLLRKDGRGMCRMHDLVFACLQHFNGGGITDAAIDAKVKQFFSGTWEAGSYHFQRSLQIHAAFIQSWVNVDDPQPSLETYLYQLAESISKSVAFQEKLRAYATESFVAQHEACLSIVEAIEQRYQNEANEKEKELILNEGISNISKGLEKVSDEKLKTDLLHHRGKLLHWSKNSKSAVADFEEVLKRDSGAFQSHLQMARIKAQDDNQECSKHVEIILSAFENDHEAVSITIVLAAFTELEKKPNANLRETQLVSKPSLLMETISLAVAEGFSQPYRTLGRIGRYIFYPHPKALIQMAEKVSFPSPAAAKEKECFDIAECMKSVGKACADHRNNNGENLRWYEQAVEYYDRMPKPNEFQLTMKAEYLILLGRCKDAIKALDQCEAPAKQPHWWHRRSQALLGMNQTSEALTAIEKALSENRDKKYLSAFLQTKAKIEVESNSPNAVTTLETAISNAGDGKFKSALETELEIMKLRFQ